MVAAHLNVNAPASVAIHRAAAAGAAVIPHERRDMHHRPFAELPLVDAAGHGEQPVADHLALQPTDRHPMQQVVVRINLRAGHVWLARLPVRTGEDHLSNHVLQRPVAVHELRGEKIEQIRMRGRLAGGAEVVDRLDDAAPKQMMPDTVHHHAGDERVGRVDHAPGQSHPATPAAGRLALGQGLQKRSRHQFRLR